jgi:hypothetical protein
MQFVKSNSTPKIKKPPGSGGFLDLPNPEIEAALHSQTLPNGHLNRDIRRAQRSREFKRGTGEREQRIVAVMQHGAISSQN